MQPRWHNSSFVKERRQKSKLLQEPRHRIDFLNGIVGQPRRNQICVGVWGQNVDTKRVSSKKRRQKFDLQENLNTERVSLGKPQVSFSKIKSVSKFGRETSTQNRPPQQNRRSAFGKSNLCRRFRRKPRHKTEFIEKRRHKMDLPAKRRHKTDFG